MAMHRERERERERVRYVYKPSVGISWTFFSVSTQRIETWVQVEGVQGWKVKRSDIYC